MMRARSGGESSVRRSTKCSTLFLGAMACALLPGYFSSGETVGAQAGQQDGRRPSSPDSADFSGQERAIIKTLSPLPALPVDTTNKYRDSPAAALLGQKLFFEPRLAGPIQTGTPQDGQLGAIGETHKIACRHCHMPESKWLFDIRS